MKHGESQEPLDVEQGSPEEQTVSEQVAECPEYVVGIGASAGGLEALERLFQSMPDDTGMAFVVVQHLSPDFKSVMNELLARWTKMPIHAVEDRMPLAANQIFLMPPNVEMIVSDGKLLLTPRERSDELHLPIDQFFRSLARDAGPRSIAVILSGTGSDGSRGIRDVHAAGGLVFVQNEETAKFDGMPKSAIETGIVDAVRAPDEIAATLLEHIDHPAAVHSIDDETEGMASVFKLLREAYGIDFSCYKPSTVQRRTEHRLQLSRIDDLEEYLDRLREDREELDALYRDLLIGVTSFFRDPDSYTALEEEVLPGLLENIPDGGDFRVWVAGCATGEEPYSLAILVHEQIQKQRKHVNAKVFATDVHRRSLETAAAGVYSEEAVATVSAERLNKYFIKIGDNYRVSPDLRSMVVFAPHNIVKDAPFTRLHLISCRNLLIYLMPSAQKKALCLFHFGLKKDGVLFLGPSESPGDLSTEFDPINQHWKLFRKRRDVRLLADMRLPLSSGVPNYSGVLQTPARQPENQFGEVFESLLDQTLPPSVLVDEQLRIVHTFGNTSPYLRLRKGVPSLSLTDMLSEDLRTAVGAAVHRAMREKEPVSFSGISMKRDDAEISLDVGVIPLPATRRVGPHALIRFEEGGPAQASLRVDLDMNVTEVSRQHIESLETELRFTKETLQATIQELETSNEELQATNEELLASNEELQSTNEELHSVNEELYTVNAEYQRKIQELIELTNDMDNLLSSTEVHTLFLDQDLCIRKFTPKMADVFNLISSDVGRKIHGFVHTIECAHLPDKLHKVSRDGTIHEEEVHNVKGDFFLMRILPYRGDIDRAGVVMTLVDINRIKEAEDRFRNAVEVSPNGMLMVDGTGRITLVNSEIERMFGYRQEELIGKPLETLMPEDMRKEHEELRKVYFQNPYVIRRMGGMSFVWGRRRNRRRIPLDVRVNPIKTPSGTQAIVSLVDVSHHQKLQASLGEKVEQRDRFLAILSHELRNPMGAILTAASVLDRAASNIPKVEQPCSVIRRQATQMATLLDDLLDVARITSGKIKLRLEVTDLAEVCGQAIEAVAPQVTAHRHQVEFEHPESPVWVHVDRGRMQQVVENLLTNAIKYTPERGRIVVTVETEGRETVIRIRDNGCGMTKELLETIFDMFVQSDETLHRSEGGMGVGLTLVHSLVELHHGTIDAHSDGPGKGSTFTVRLPVTDKRPIRDRPSPPIHTSDEVRIVLVEDNHDARTMLAALLDDYGYRVVATAGDGQQGFEAIQTHQPDVALLDIGLPELDGYQLARRIRNQMGTAIRLIALTGYGRGEDHKAVLESGFDEHLVKPINIDTLADVLESLTTRR
jgi:two-component system, chemotaxis family, CheB/CheR fusion protein